MLEEVPQKKKGWQIKTTPSFLFNVSEYDTKDDMDLTNEITAAHFRGICNGKIKGGGHKNTSKENQQQSKCHYVHHFNSYLNIGPFRFNFIHHLEL